MLFFVDSPEACIALAKVLTQDARDFSLLIGCLADVRLQGLWADMFSLPSDVTRKESLQYFLFRRQALQDLGE